jgi:enoyl-CoA hydratase
VAEQDAFRVERDAVHRTATIRLARRDQGNRLNLQEISILGQTIRELSSEPATKLLIIRGEGRDFCLGRAPGPVGQAPKSALQVRNQITQPILDVYAEIRAAPVPVLAAVQGRASGFGCALVAQCDLAIGAEDAAFSLPEMDHDLPPTLAISAMLHKAPIKPLLHLVYTRDSIRAAEALSLGILGRVVPAAALDDAVRETAAKLSGRNRAAICAIKEYVLSAAHADPHGAARLAANLLATVFSSPKED